MKKKVGAVLSESEYNLRVRAVDDVTAVRGDSSKESVTSLRIQVLEENNHKPTFSGCDTLRYVSEIHTLTLRTVHYNANRGNLDFFQELTKNGFRTNQNVFSRIHIKVGHFKEIESAAKMIEEFTH